MKQAFFATTALAALAWIPSAAADITMSGNIGLSHDAGGKQSGKHPGYDLSLKAQGQLDDQLSYGGAVKFSSDEVKDASNEEYYLWTDSKFGTATLGKHHGVAHTMSVGANRRDTVSAYGLSHYSSFQDQSTPRVSYMTPEYAGFQFGVSSSQDTGASGSELQAGVSYSFPVGYSTIRLAHSSSSVRAVDGVAPRMKGRETGIEFSRGKFTASFLTFKKEKSGIVTTRTPKQYVIVSTASEVVVPAQPESMARGIVFPTATSFIACRDVVETIGADLNCNIHYKINQDGNIDYPTAWVPLPGLPEMRWSSSSEQMAFVHTDWETNSMDHSELTKGNEIELAYSINDAITINAVHYEAKTDSAMNDQSSYNQLSVGGKYMITPGMTASLSHSTIDDNGFSAKVMRLRLAYSF